MVCSHTPSVVLGALLTKQILQRTQMIRECATHAGESMKLARGRLEAMRQNSLHVAADGVLAHSKRRPGRAVDQTDPSAKSDVP
jgi:hypothetical protein